MHVSSIIPVLLNIILTEQNNQKQAKDSQVKGKTIKQNNIPMPSNSTESTKHHYKTAENNEPVLLPLPLKTPLFSNTQFFTFNRPAGEQKNRDGEKAEKGIVFALSTQNLGRLFFILYRKTKTLNITCHAENEEIAMLLTSRSTEFKNLVQKMGFEKIIFNCTALDPQLHNLPTGLSSSGLLDLKV